MPYFCLSDGFHRAPNVEALSMGARGLFATVASWVGGELYENTDFDGVFDKRRCRMLGGTPRMIAELVDAGLFEQAGGGYRIVESRRVGGFDNAIFKNPDKVRAGRKGGLARARSTPDGWHEAHAQADCQAESKRNMDAASSENTSFPEAKPKQDNASASNLLQADGKQNASDAQASASSRPSAKPKPQVAGTIPTPTPSTAGAEARAEAEPAAVNVDAVAAKVEHAIDRDPFALCWATYRPKAGSRDKAEAAFTAVVESGVTARRLYGAILRHNRAIDHGDIPLPGQPGLQHWLERGLHIDYLPAETTPKPIEPHRHTWNCPHVKEAMKDHEHEYSHERDGYQASPWMNACQAKAQELNDKEQQ